ncbi:MAG TPA: translation elongation factor 4 [Kiritimatiellia bacterium]|nr:translation elongation factor 4 [Kiritimatiellia bacterium]HNS80365.1 translation elongation factor 4 [Kiritimatiellia bacterium]HPA78087.1 translation elongation factor 4 [Kiritimatiellia bacterium]HQQ04329.1 translation elongation factor 4 [Kiritimatiellia bacterium]
MSNLSHIRNFCIIAHIDHGKSTLADRMLDITGTIQKRLQRDQLLDAMDLERERGITIKSHPVAMNYRAADGKQYLFHLIDTPGHVDFTYEVERSLAACEGALLVVDVAQGVEAQTVANSHLAVNQGLTIIPVFNKIDLPSSDIEGTRKQIEDVLAIPAEDALCVSAKTGEGVAEILQAIVERVPPPSGDPEGASRALVFDSIYDAYRGVVTYIRVVDGTFCPGEKIRMMATGQDYEIKEVGKFVPQPVPVKMLGAGEVGYIIANIKEASEIRIGDTVTSARRPAAKALPGFKEIHPMVFAGLYPIDTSEYEKLKASLDKLRLNDCSFVYQAESSVALGFGFRCGFLGLLHLEVIQERLRREYDLDLISTYPGVVYRVHLTSGEMIEVDNPVYLPETTRIVAIEEPMVTASIICHNEHIGDMMQLIMDRRGILEHTHSMDTRRVMLTCKLPLNEILLDFHDRLKSVSRGYSSMDYEHAGYQPSDLVKLDILVNGDVVDAFSCIIHRSKAESRGREICKSLKEVIPPQQFQIPLQAAIGRNIIARETIRAFRKDVTAKCYGGDITRKRKLLEKQKEGKKKMKLVGKVSIPQDAFVSVLKANQ